MSDPLVSIVVPVYKVELYLHRCLDSIVAQTYSPLEVILVNDGSPDGCGEIIRQYEAEWPFIRSIWQENSGVSVARNVGIASATGKYLALIDSDDYVEPDFISALVHAAESGNAEVAVCNFFIDFPNGLKIPFPLMTLQKKMTGEKAAQISLKLLSIPTFSWNKLYRRDLFTDSGISFPSIYYEDLAIASKVLSRAKRVAIRHKPLYHYCLRRSGAVGSFGMKHVLHYLKAVNIVRHFIWDEGLWTSWKIPYHNLLRSAEAMLLIEIALQKNMIPFHKRRHLILQVHQRIRRLRLPPNVPYQASSKKTFFDIKGLFFPDD